MEEIKFSNGTIAVPLPLQDAYIIRPKIFGDDRGAFCPSYIKEYMETLGFKDVLQENWSKSHKGVLRGLHFQKDPYAQAKIVKVITGEVYDVIVDIRKNSPTYGKGAYVLLTGYNANIPGSGQELFIPSGFAHGFLCTKDNTIFSYLVDNKYNIESEEGILWNDKSLDIPWTRIFEKANISEDELDLSEKDKVREPLAKQPTYFEYKPKTLTLHK